MGKFSTAVLWERTGWFLFIFIVFLSLLPLTKCDLSCMIHYLRGDWGVEIESLSTGVCSLIFPGF